MKIKLFKRFQNNKPHTFLAEVAILLLSINHAALCIDFFSTISGKTFQKSTELNLINLYKTSKSKLTLEAFLKDEIDNFNTISICVFSDNKNNFKSLVKSQPSIHV